MCTRADAHKKVNDVELAVASDQHRYCFAGLLILLQDSVAVNPPGIPMPIYSLLYQDR